MYRFSEVRAKCRCVDLENSGFEVTRLRAAFKHQPTYFSFEPWVAETYIAFTPQVRLLQTQHRLAGDPRRRGRRFALE